MKNLRAAVDAFFRKMYSSWYNTGMENLVLHYDKCLDMISDYVEK